MSNENKGNELGNWSHPCENTDREIYRASPGDYYAPSVHVTSSGALGINISGSVIVLSLERWHALGRMRAALSDVIAV